MSAHTTSIFISYSRTDSAFVDKLKADLDKHYDIWIDREELRGGQNWRDKLEEAIDKCEVLIVILPAESAKLQYIKMEYRYAQNQKKLVIPVRHLPTSKVPMDLNELQLIDFVENEYERALQYLLRTLDSNEIEAYSKIPEALREPAQSIQPTSASKVSETLQEPAQSIQPVFAIDNISTSSTTDKQPSFDWASVFDPQPQPSPQLVPPTQNIEPSVSWKDFFSPEYPPRGNSTMYFCSVIGFGSVIGIIFRSWPSAVATVVIAAIVIYLIGARKYVYLSTVPTSVFIGCVVACGIALYASTLHYDVPQTSYLWLVGQRSVWYGRQVDFGFIVSPITFIALLTSVGNISDKITWRYLYSERERGIAWEIFIIFVRGLIIWLVPALLATVFGMGFGFGEGWYYSILALLAGTLSWLGVFYTRVVCS